MIYNFLKQEQNIKKYDNGGISDTWNTRFDRKAVNTSYYDVYKNILNDPDFDLNNFNDFLGQYYILRNNSKYVPGSKKAKYLSGTQNYQKLYDKYGFHTNAFTNGWEHVTSANTGDRFGDNWTGDNWFGAITNQRYANSFNNEELVKMNDLFKSKGVEWVLDDRASGIDTGDGRQFYKLQKITPERINTTTTSNNTDSDNTNSDNTSRDTTPVDFPKEMEKRRQDPWTDWLPISIQHAEDMMLADRYAELKKKLRFPLKLGPYLQHKITDDYYLRSALRQQASELRRLGKIRSQSSDLSATLDNTRKYDVEAANLEALAEGQKAIKYGLEIQKALEVSNINKQVASEVGNYNAAQNAAALNNIVEANAERAARRAASMKNYIGNMATSHGLWLKDARLNDYAYTRGMNLYLYNLDAAEAYKEWDNLSDFTKSKAYKLFIADIDAKVVNPEGFQSNRWNSDLAAYAKELWESLYGSPYRTKWNTEYQNNLNNYYDRMRQLKSRLDASNLLIPDIVNNQGFRFIDKNVSPTYLRYYPSHKSGGTVARFIDYTRHLERTQKHTKDLLHKRVLETNKNLSADLDRLSKEEMMLLRAIFK